MMDTIFLASKLELKIFYLILKYWDLTIREYFIFDRIEEWVLVVWRDCFRGSYRVIYKI
jgi:hypothetical protein